VRLLVIGVGNAWRSDDGAGLAVVRALRQSRLKGVEVLEREGEPTGLVDAWEGAEAVWLVDAVVTGAAPGTVHRLDASERELPAGLVSASTHHLGLSEAVELARALDRLPARVVFYGIEAAGVEPGDTLTPEVSSAVERVVESVREEVERCTSAS
jgi:hydrogenase maturation protease